MKITPQDIIDREFKVKFRGFDVAEVDSFLEEVAENFFKLLEENTLLHEKILALKQELESADRITAQAQVELPVEVNNFLEELKQDINSINAELVALKQDRSTLTDLRKSIGDAVGTLQKAASTPPQKPAPAELPDDFKTTIQGLKADSETIKTELAAIKNDSLSLESLQKNLEETVASLQKTGAQESPQAHVVSGDFANTLNDFKQITESMGTELVSLRQEISSMQQVRQELKEELQELLKSHFDDLSTRLSQTATAAAPAEPEPLVAAIIKEEEPATQEEDAGFVEEAEDEYDDDLEFLSEDDILDVDKLRGVFQSVLDDSVGDSFNSREADDDISADLLFLDDSLIDNDPEPAVTYSLDNESSGEKTQ